MIPFITSRTSTWRLLPPRLAGGINGSTCAHSSSVRSLGYRNLLRSQRPRFFAVHIGGASLESGHHFESQTIQRTQNVFGRTLSEGRPPAREKRHDRSNDNTRHCSLARLSIAVRRCAIFVVTEGQRPHPRCSYGRHCCLHDESLIKDIYRSLQNQSCSNC